MNVSLLALEDGDVAGLGRAVIRLLQDGERACRSAGEARRVLLERYALDRMLNDLDAVYRELVNRETCNVMRET